MTTPSLTRPIRVQLRRAKGWRMPENAVRIDRATWWGNPFIVGTHGDQEHCVALYRQLLTTATVIPTEPDSAQAQARCLVFVQQHLFDLRGRDLACWCAPGTPCHGDVLLELAALDPDIPVLEPKIRED